MTITDRIDAARRRFEDKMIDTCTITRGDSQGAFNPATLQHDAAVPTTIYSGACLAQTGSGAGDEEQHGDETIVLDQLSVFIPAAEDAVAVDDRVTFVTSGDPALQGAVVRVIAVKAKSMTPARRLVCSRNLG